MAVCPHFVCMFDIQYIHNTDTGNKEMLKINGNPMTTKNSFCN